MKCEMIDVEPEGTETECDGEAVALVETTPSCERHRAEAERGGGLCIMPLGSTREEYQAECARLRALGLY